MQSRGPFSCWDFSLYKLFILLMLLQYLEANVREQTGLKTAKTAQVRRNSNDMEKFFSDEDVTVDIGEEEQALLLKKAELDCLHKLLDDATSINDMKSCPVYWDTVTCWPRTPVNQSFSLPCPNYVNKFNRKNNASKHCLRDTNTSRIKWSKTDYKQCMKPSEYFSENLNESHILEAHMNKIITIRIVGYVVSMVTLVASIIILLRPKLRCPRNFVHINLFIAFVMRIVLVMIVEIVLKNKSSSLFQTKKKEAFIMILEQKEESSYIFCKILMTMFRYSGSVYNVAIFSEAIYLVLLLKFPYYSERKGMNFCIITSWTLPFLWLIPWVLVKIIDDDFWCWQTESDVNLITKIPHSMLLTANIVCAIFIIRILYSKMNNRMNRDKLIKYRRLAKSVFILIPIFGLHFIVFAWLPYIEEIDPIVEITTAYVETFFNAFQGFVVAMACCFIHHEVRIELQLILCTILSKVRCLRNASCINTDYVGELRYRQRHGSSALELERRRLLRAVASQSSTTASMALETEAALRRNSNSLTPTYGLDARRTSTSASLASIPQVANLQNSGCCWWLFGAHKNDFYTTHQHRRSTMGDNMSNLRLLARHSSVGSMFRSKEETTASGQAERPPSPISLDEITPVPPASPTSPMSGSTSGYSLGSISFPHQILKRLGKRNSSPSKHVGFQGSPELTPPVPPIFFQLDSIPDVSEEPPLPQHPPSVNHPFRRIITGCALSNNNTEMITIEEIDKEPRNLSRMDGIRYDNVSTDDNPDNLPKIVLNLSENPEEDNET